MPVLHPARERRTIDQLNNHKKRRKLEIISRIRQLNLELPSQDEYHTFILSLCNLSTENLLGSAGPLDVSNKRYL